MRTRYPLVFALCILVLAGWASSSSETPPVAETCTGPPSRQEPINWVDPQYPQYPMRAAQRQVEGWVDLSITLCPSGKVKSVAICSSSDAGFERSALSSVRKWRYPPSQEADPSEITLRIRYVMDSVGEDPYFVSPQELIVMPRLPNAIAWDGPSVVSVDPMSPDRGAVPKKRDPCAESSEGTPEGKSLPEAPRASEDR